MYEHLLDKATGLSWTEGPEAAERLRLQREDIFRQLTQFPAETMPVLLNALRVSDQHRRVTAIEVLDKIGYPTNEPAIPALLNEIGSNDPNSPVWSAAVTTLSNIGVDGVTPYLIRELLESVEREELSQQGVVGSSEITLSEYLEGLSLMLGRTTLGSEWAVRCCPAINYILTSMFHNDAIERDITDSLLYVVENAADKVEYMLPVLLALAKRYGGTDIGRRAKKLIFLNSQRTIEMYKLLLL